MLLTIATTHAPATDLGYLLGKNPARTQSFPLNFGQAHVYYPVATDEQCTAALLLDVDPVGLVRRPRGIEGLAQYTNDRPYVASSFLGVAIGKVYRGALSGRCKERPALAEQALPLEATLSVVPTRGGDRFVRALFEPLGYEVTVQRHALDADYTDWGDSVYATLTLRGTVRLQALLRHLTVLIPVLDDAKHYWVGQDEIEKLLTRGEGWLATHPERDAIAERYLKHRRSLTRAALERLADEYEPDADATEASNEREEETLERPLSLNDRRIEAVVTALRRNGVRRVVDVGCGEGKLLRALLRDSTFERIVGMDVSMTALERAKARLHFDNLGDRQKARLDLFQGSLTYRDERLSHFDGACAVEVIEHIEEPRLTAFEHTLFHAARPGCVVVTTPNVEYNAKFESLPAGAMRHRDHRFEWTRAQFERWAQGVAERNGYTVSFEPIGDEAPQLGAPTQMGVFTR